MSSSLEPELPLQLLHAWQLPQPLFPDSESDDPAHPAAKSRPMPRMIKHIIANNPFIFNLVP
jgi:hypothetical protein